MALSTADSLRVLGVCGQKPPSAAAAQTAKQGSKDAPLEITPCRWGVAVTNWGGLRLTLSRDPRDAPSLGLSITPGSTLPSAPAIKAGRDFDLLIYGATGFTGRLMVQHLDALLSEPKGPKLRWAIGGRDSKKLADLARTCKTSPSILIGASQSEVSQMAAKSRVVVSAAGPYQLCGEVVVKACVENGAHYVDVTGETIWVHDMIQRYHEEAKRKGVMIVHCSAQVCAIDEVNCYLLAKKLGPLKQFREYFFQYGGTTGGTFHTSLTTMEGITAERLKVMNDPFNLGGKRDRGVLPEEHDCSQAVQDPLFPSLWQQPAYNGHTGSRVIRRSVQLFEEEASAPIKYGKGLVVVVRDAATSKRAAEQGVQMAGPLPSVEAAAFVAKAMKQQRDMGQAPPVGQGPPAATRDQYYSEVFAVAEGENGEWSYVRFTGPEAYEVTAMAGIVGALVLAEEEDAVKPKLRGGVVTPAYAFHGSTFVERLEAKSFACGKGRKLRFEVHPGKPPEEDLRKAITDKGRSAAQGQADLMAGKLRPWALPS